jgi:ferrochelatase
MSAGVLFVNFGGPTQHDELEPFLRNLLADVLPGPRWLKAAAAGRLAPLRAKRVAEKYAAIGWSPVTADSRAQAEAAMQRLGERAPIWEIGMMFTRPSIEDGLRRLVERGCDRVAVVGLYPHWSFATSGAAANFVAEAASRLGPRAPRIALSAAFYDHPAYVDAVAATIEATTADLGGGGPITLLFSAHGVPTSFLRRGDPYADHVQGTVRAVVRRLGWKDPVRLAWQSRLGPVRWLGPNVADEVPLLAREGVSRLIIVPVSFVGEHIETLDELDRELVPEARHAGIRHVGRAAAVGMQPRFLDALAEVTAQTLASFGKVHCVRCLLPKGPRHHAATCLDCGFQPPEGLRAASYQPATTSASHG